MTAALRLGSPSRRRRPRRAQRIVLAWVRLYTRDLPDAVADDRRDELASDLWEQEVAAGGGSGTGLSMLWRMARGVPADVAWRGDRIRDLPLAERPARWWRWTASGSVLAAALVGAAVAAYGIDALARIGRVLVGHGYPPSDLTTTSTGIGTVALLCGLALLIRPRTRWIGALWLAAGSAITLWFGTVTMLTLSATAQAVYYGTLSYGPDVRSPAVLAAWGGLAVVVMFFACLAIAWIPTRTEVRR
jgi:hypothetical protein